jgi:hypothetical protein
LVGHREYGTRGYAIGSIIKELLGFPWEGEGAVTENGHSYLTVSFDSFFVCLFFPPLPLSRLAEKKALVGKNATMGRIMGAQSHTGAPWHPFQSILLHGDLMNADGSILLFLPSLPPNDQSPILTRHNSIPWSIIVMLIITIGGGHGILLLLGHGSDEGKDHLQE